MSKAEYIVEAIEKLKSENKKNCNTSKAKAVKPYVYDVLCNFCKQNEEFAKAVVQSDKTLCDCCEEIIKDSNTHISDLEVYERAVAFYFPGAGINSTMKINLCSSVDGESKSGKFVNLSLSDLLVE